MPFSPTKESIEKAWGSIQNNWPMWATYAAASLLFAWDNPLKGMATVLTLIFASYAVHRASHDEINLLTIVHVYHHNHTDWIAYFSQIMLELLFGVVALSVSVL